MTLVLFVRARVVRSSCSVMCRRANRFNSCLVRVRRLVLLVRVALGEASGSYDSCSVREGSSGLFELLCVQASKSI
jgi:hypothetical protein